VKLSCHDICLSYGGVSILRHVNLTVESGEVVAILGPSGSGKSSLLRVVAGLANSDSGSIALDDTPITELAPHKRGIGMVFQSGQLFPHMTVGENVAYGLRMKKVAATERRVRVQDMLELVQLPDFADRRVDTLSGGEATRVALARALAPRPNIVLLDEPLTGLDRDLHDELAEQLRHVLTTAGITSLLVTHDPNEARTVADRSVRLAELMSAP
jgi:thiamine transport system ATP-binding protein